MDLLICFLAGCAVASVYWGRALKEQEQRWSHAVGLLRKRIRGVSHKAHSPLVQRESFESYLHRQGVL